MVHFDPRDLSKPYVPHEGDYLDVPYADLRQPPVSLWEAKAAARHLREAGERSIEPALLIEAIERQRKIVRAAQRKTRAMRRRQQAAHRPAASSAGDPLRETPAPPDKEGIDWSKPAKAFRGEVWKRGQGGGTPTQS